MTTQLAQRFLMTSSRSAAFGNVLASSARFELLPCLALDLFGLLDQFRRSPRCLIDDGGAGAGFCRDFDQVIRDAASGQIAADEFPTVAAGEPERHRFFTQRMQDARDIDR